ncbi:MAG: hypothetical protein R6X31_05855 [Anaerolineae bacterium]
MRSEWKWLVFVGIAVGLLATGLLIVLFAPRFGWAGIHDYGEGYCPFCGGTGVLNLWDVFAILAIVLLALNVLLSHLAALVLVVRWIARPEGSPGRVKYRHSMEEADSSLDDATGPAVPLSSCALPDEVGLGK